jgi:hypothetical protein
MVLARTQWQILFFCLVNVWACPNWAQDPVSGLTAPQLDNKLDELRATFTHIEAIPIPKVSFSSPAYAIAIPTGYGARAGQVFVGAGGLFDRQVTGSSQLGLGLGIGLGNPVRGLGVDLSYTLLDVNEGVGGLSLKFHRNLSTTAQVGWALAVGWEDFVSSGGRGSSVYGSTSLILKLSPDLNTPLSRLALTIGLGGGRFGSPDGIPSIGVFGGGALRVTRSLSVIGEWTGQDLTAGISIAPFPDLNFYITPAVRELGDANQARFSLSSGIIIDF